MKLLIIGYGKMGRAIERLAPQYGFQSVVIIDNEEDWLQKTAEVKTCDVAIEFSTPQSVLSNVTKCFEMKMAVVSGTTGWEKQKEEFFKLWHNKTISFIYGTNFSIGANIFFKLNEFLAKQMNTQHQYHVSIEETHHINKKDAPSGTAITIEKTILSQFDNKTPVPINSIRKGEVVGEHLVNYISAEDIIQIKHNALNREAFAHGALKAAVWLPAHKGIYAFEDIFQKV
ncbi:MAG: 4-hydroxy-tetrahydrodipicolinate reductase [Bacteroidetes bacterium]|nr:4-hydroxy-tetrahydrodipicolinate reductase [Bacteroidota bacterium]MCL1968365.1 4-hydroxy-tetrahydrodipicolinate reductase [Bacteroidota bacterium]